MTRNITGPIRAQIAMDWACANSATRGVAGQAARLSQVRGFLSFLRASFPDTEVPDHSMLATARRPQPYIFNPSQIQYLLIAALKMRPANTLRPLVWHTLIGLLASTGLRIGEALRLKISDVMLESDPAYLKIIETKFRKSRLVPLRISTVERLQWYAKQRQRLGYNALSDYFFISEQGKPLDPASTWRCFSRLTKQLNMIAPDQCRHPSLHCLRHTFAVERLREWYQQGIDVQAMIPNLSVYLGHIQLQESYWYLSATPELLTVASERFRRYTEEGDRLQ